MFDFVELVVKLIGLVLANRFNWEEVYRSHRISPTEMEEAFVAVSKKGIEK